MVHSHYNPLPACMFGARCLSRTISLSKTPSTHVRLSDGIRLSRQMDPLSITLSVTALLKLTKDVVFYVKEAKDASDERKKFVRETSGLSGMLTTLIDFVNEEDRDNPWLIAILQLVAKDGPVDQFALALQQLKAKIAPTSGV